MAKSEILTQEVLLQLLRYDKVTGCLFWRPRGVEWFRGSVYPAEREIKRWNTRFAGKEALCHIDFYGYKVGLILGFPVKAHRVIWKMVHGEWPVQIDHEHGCGSNNRLSNMREAPQSANNKNAARRKDNSTGVTGISFRKSSRKWHARIGVDGKDIHLGFFDEKIDAVKVRRSAEERYGFHKNHGREPLNI